MTTETETILVLLGAVILLAALLAVVSVAYAGVIQQRDRAWRELAKLRHPSMRGRRQEPAVWQADTRQFVRSMNDAARRFQG